MRTIWINNLTPSLTANFSRNQQHLKKMIFMNRKWTGINSMTLLDIEKYMVEEYFKFKNMDEVNFYNFFELGIKYVIHINVLKCLNLMYSSTTCLSKYTLVMEMK